jgi:hypothetical protein
MTTTTCVSIELTSQLLGLMRVGTSGTLSCAFQPILNALAPLGCVSHFKEQLSICVLSIS